MDPGPEFASPPETDQLTLAAPPPKVAENSSTNPPDVVPVLHPVQLVSMVAVPGVMERLPLEEPPPDAPPPQPARITSAGNIALASMRPGHCRNE
jgi:hypothetical protein